MKNYFSFHLKGEDIFTPFIIIVLTILIPLIIYSFSPSWHGILHIGFLKGLVLVISVIVMVLVALILGLQILKQSIEGVEFKENRFFFHGESGEYIALILRGIILTIITIGIYSVWFQRDLIRFYARNTSYKDKFFEFRGRAEDLLIIAIAALVVPGIIFALIFPSEGRHIGSLHSFKAYFSNIVEAAIFAPFTYLYYRWIIHFIFNGKRAYINSDTMEGIKVVLLQSVLAAITLGIYFPVAGLKIYQYFLQKLEVEGENGGQYSFDYDIEETRDFLFIWGQLLMTIFSIGIYSPWAFCRVYERILGKTFMETQE